MNNILTFNNITKYFNELKALDNVTINIPRNSIYGILGSNGSGKSTLFRIVSNLILKYTGTIKFENKILNSSTKDLIDSFGFLIENPSFYEYLSGQQNLELLSRISQSDSDNIENILKLVELSDRANDKVRTYSYGMKQRLGLAQTLLHKPKILILDEPNNGLDPKGIINMSNIIKRLHEDGKTIILSTHILTEIESLCTHFTILKNGKNIATNSIKNLLSKSNHYTIEVNNIKSAIKLLSKIETIQILSSDDNFINFTSENKIDNLFFLKHFDNKITIYQLLKKSGLIKLFND